jgi:nitrate reductase assembly molybdenum cofactor insertion protein NarJ
MKELGHYSHLAWIFRYPDRQRAEHTAEWREIVGRILPGSLPAMESFIAHVVGESLEMQQEYFISTFDVQAVCFLDIGYILYGEDYNRGVFLSHMKREQEQSGNDCGSELPDHLPCMLSLLPKMQDQVLAEELVVSVMVPALKKMVSSFRPTGNLYREMLDLLAGIMEREFPGSSFEPFEFNTLRKNEAFQRLPHCMKNW